MSAWPRNGQGGRVSSSHSNNSTWHRPTRKPMASGLRTIISHCHCHAHIHIRTLPTLSLHHNVHPLSFASSRTQPPSLPATTNSVSHLNKGKARHDLSSTLPILPLVQPLTLTCLSLLAHHGSRGYHAGVSLSTRPTTMPGRSPLRTQTDASSSLTRLDNSEWMRNGDYTPSRWEAQSDAVSMIFDAKTNSNPESEVGLMTMAGKR